jgi:D-arabinose 1-dehydrogenase-like Zn-dependent alcohol dehydrogenase
VAFDSRTSVACRRCPTRSPDRATWSSVEAVGICGTDIHVLDGDFAPTVFRSSGHEISGVVEVVRDEVTVRRQT